MDVDLVIFDCNGVLVDSEGLCAEVLHGDLPADGIEVPLGLLAGSLPGQGFAMAANAVRQASGRALSDGFRMRYAERLLERFETDLNVTEGLAAVLGRLRPRACVTTGACRMRVDRTLELAGLAEFFDGRVFCAAEVTRRKPAPDLFLHAARHMGVAPHRVAVIEDSAAGLAAAMAAGMQPIFFAGASHMRGADLSDWQDEVPVLRHWREVPPSLLTADVGDPVH